MNNSRSLFKKILKQKENSQRNNMYGKNEFKNTMDFVNETLEKEYNLNDQVTILDYILRVVKEDLKTDLLTTILYSEKYFKKRMNYIFPINYYDENGRRFSLCVDESREQDVDLKNDCVLVLPWNRDRLRGTVKNISKNNFRYDALNHMCYYFTHVDIYHAYNGTHSISSGIVYRKGTIKAQVCDIGKLFPHVYTDGIKWYNYHDNTELADVFDFRIAIIYEISKEKYKIQSKD